jgi:hypothetical protein
MRFPQGDITVCADGSIKHPVESLNFPVREEVLDAAQMRIVNLRASVPDELPMRFSAGYVFWEDGRSMSAADYEQVHREAGGR